jgi:hypothetical protein
MRERVGRSDPTDGEGRRLSRSWVGGGGRWRSDYPPEGGEAMAERQTDRKDRWGCEGLRRSATRVSSRLVADPLSQVSEAMREALLAC